MERVFYITLFTLACHPRLEFSETDRTMINLRIYRFISSMKLDLFPFLCQLQTAMRNLRDISKILVTRKGELSKVVTYRTAIYKQLLQLFDDTLQEGSTKSAVELLLFFRYHMEMGQSYRVEGDVMKLEAH